MYTMIGKIVGSTIGLGLGVYLFIQGAVDNMSPTKESSEIELVARFTVPVVVGVGVGHLVDVKKKQQTQQ